MKQVRERAERVKQIREQRFEKLLDELVQQDDLKCDVASMIRAQNQREFRKQANIYSEWNDRVFGKIQRQLMKYLNPPKPPVPPTSLMGFGVLPNESFFNQPVAYVSSGADPLKRVLQASAAEDVLERAAE